MTERMMHPVHEEWSAECDQEPTTPDVERDYLPHERDQLQRDWERQIYDESAGKEAKMSDTFERLGLAEEPELPKDRMVASLRQQLAAEREAHAETKRLLDNWRDTAKQCQLNTDYYKQLVTQIGEQFGVAARTQDDEGIVENVLCAKVPELAEAELTQLRQAVGLMTTALPLMVMDVKHPIDMAQQVVRHVVDLERRLADATNEAVRICFDEVNKRGHVGAAAWIPRRFPLAFAPTTEREPVAPIELCKACGSPWHKTPGEPAAPSEETK